MSRNGARFLLLWLWALGDRTRDWLRGRRDYGSGSNGTRCSRGGLRGWSAAAQTEQGESGNRNQQQRNQSQDQNTFLPIILSRNPLPNISLGHLRRSPHSHRNGTAGNHRMAGSRLRQRRRNRLGSSNGGWFGHSAYWN